MRPGLKKSLRALSHRDFRLFFAGQAVSLVGTWMTRLASSWFVYRLTSDPFMLGAVSFAGLIPAFFLGPLAGVWVDRSRDVKRLIWQMQLAAMLQSLALAACVAVPMRTAVTIWLLIVLNVAQGVINAFDIPARQAFLPRMVPERADLANAIALNSTLFNGARLIGPAIAGAVIALAGEFWCFLADAVTYLAVLWAINAMRVPNDRGASAKKARVWQSLVEGMKYSYASEPIRLLLLLVALLSMFGMPYLVLLPIYAREILGGGPYTLGLLTSATGLGAVIGALRLASRESVAGIDRVIVFAGAVFAVALATFAYSTNLLLSVVLLLGTGFGMITQTAASNTVIQTIVEPKMRGRVMSLYATAFVGMGPFGNLLSGFLAKQIGTQRTVAFGALVCGISGAGFAWRLPALRAAIRQGQTDAFTHAGAAIEH